MLCAPPGWKDSDVNLEALNRICFTICIVCIVVGTVLSLQMIWGDIRGNEVMWKLWATNGVLFLAAALTLSVNKTLGGKWRSGE